MIQSCLDYLTFSLISYNSSFWYHLNVEFFVSMENVKPTKICFNLKFTYLNKTILTHHLKIIKGFA